MRTPKHIKIKKFKLPRKLKKEVNKIEPYSTQSDIRELEKGGFFTELRYGFRYKDDAKVNKWSRILLAKITNELTKKK